MHVDHPDSVLEAVDALRAKGVSVEPEGEEMERWRVGDFVMSDAELTRLAASRGLVDGDTAAA